MEWNWAEPENIDYIDDGKLYQIECISIHDSKFDTLFGNGSKYNKADANRIAKVHNEVNVSPKDFIYVVKEI